MFPSEKSQQSQELNVSRGIGRRVGHLALPAGFCVLGGVAAVITRGRAGSQMLRVVRGATMRLPQVARLSQARATPLELTSGLARYGMLSQGVGTLVTRGAYQQSRLMSRVAQNMEHAKHHKGNHSGSGSWKKFFRRIGAGLAVVTGVGAYGFNFHSEGSKVRVNLQEQSDLSERLNSIVALSLTGLIGRIGQTDFGYDVLDSINELVLSYTSPLLEFRENRFDEKRVCYFRGDSEFEALELVAGKSRVGSFYAFHMDEAVLPRVYHSGLESTLGECNTGGFSQGVTSLTVDFSIAAGFNHDYDKDTHKWKSNIVLLCAPKRVATTSSHQSREVKSYEGEVVVTGLRSEDIVGYLELTHDEKYEISRVNVHLNPCYDGSLDELLLDVQMQELLEKVPDDNPAKGRLLALVNSSFDSRQAFENEMPITENSLVLRAQEHLAESVHEGKWTFYGFFSSSEKTRARYQDLASDTDMQEAHVSRKLHEDEFHEYVNRFQSVDGQFFYRESEQLGSNSGGIFRNREGDKYYIKYRLEFDENAEQISRVEAVAAKLYGLFDIKTPEVSSLHFMKGGKVYCGIKSKLEGDLVPYEADESGANGWAGDSSFLKRASCGSLVDIWLGNYDVIGLGFDNLYAKQDSSGELQPVRVDTGAALGFRAQGALEPSFNEAADDFEAYFERYESTFGKCFKDILVEPELLAAAIEKLESVSNDDISAIIYDNNPCVDYGKTHEICQLLLKRRENILARAKAHLATIEQEEVSSLSM